MDYIADLHIHSPYSRATSRECSPAGLAAFLEGGAAGNAPGAPGGEGRDVRAALRVPAAAAGDLAGLDGSGMMEGWISIERCPLCGGQVIPHTVVYTAPFLMVQFAGGSLPVVTASTYVRCAECGLIIQSPRITNERLNEYYASGAYRATLGLSQQAIDRDETNRAQNLADWIYQLGLRPGSHLDIGCSRGFFLEWTQAGFDCDILGYEPLPGYTHSWIPTVQQLPEREFDLVSMIHVLEHSPDPVQDLADAAARVNSGSSLASSTPPEKRPRTYSTGEKTSPTRRKRNTTRPWRHSTGWRIRNREMSTRESATGTSRASTKR